MTSRGLIVRVRHVARHIFCMTRRQLGSNRPAKLMMKHHASEATSQLSFQSNAYLCVHVSNTKRIARAGKVSLESRTANVSHLPRIMNITQLAPPKCKILP